MKTPLQSMKHSLLVLVLCWAATGEAQIFDEDYQDTSIASGGVSAKIGLASDRIYRGQNLYDGTSLQPNLEVAVGSPELSGFVRVHGHVSLDQGSPRKSGSQTFSGTDSDGNTVTAAEVQESFYESQLDVGVRTQTDVARIELGNRWIYYSEDTPRLKETAEAFTKVDFEAPLNPHIAGAFDWEEHDGWYYEAGVHETLPLTGIDHNTTVTPSLTLGFSEGLNDGDSPIYDDNGLMYYDIGVASSVPITDSLRVEPELHYLEGEDRGTDSEFWFAVNLVGKFGS